MTATLSFSEIKNIKKATEEAIGKLLLELQMDTGAIVNGLNITKIIGTQGSKIINVSIEMHY